MRRFQGVAAAVFACAAGCGKTQTFVDGGNADASKAVDAATTPDAVPMGNVTVTAYSRNGQNEANHALEAGVKVYAVQPGGVLGPTGTTDATGTAVLTGVVSGATVAVVYTYATSATQHEVFATVFLGVKPGDHLVVGDQFADALPATTGTPAMTVTFPSVTNALTYTVYTPCGTQPAVTGSGLTQVTVPITCTKATTNLFVTAQDEARALLAAGEIKNASFTDGQTAALAAWTPVTTNGFTTGLTGLIPDVSNAQVNAEAVIDGVTTQGGSNGGTPISGAYSAMMTVPGVGERIYAWASMSRPGRVGSQETYTNLATSATTAALTEPAMPWLGQIIFNNVAQLVTWVPIGTGSYDAAVIFLNNWSHLDPGTNVTTVFTVKIVVPPGVPSVSWAGAPAEVAAALPTPTDSPIYSMQLVDLANAASYDQLRQLPEWQWTCPSCVTQTGEVTGTSSAVFDGGEGFTGLPAPTGPRAPAPPRSAAFHH